SGGVDVGSLFFFSSRRRHTRLVSDWSSDVCSSDLAMGTLEVTKVPSTPSNPAVGLVRGISAILAASDRPASSVAGLAHGTTVAKIGRASCRERGESWGGGG